MSEMSLVNPDATTPDTAITRNRITWMVDWKNANVRPRVASSTSSPTIVFPVAYAMPASAPRMATNSVTRARLGTSAISASGTAAAAMDRPNSLRRLKSFSRTPTSMPSASPTKMRREHQAPAGAGPVQRVGDVNVAQADDHARRGERAESCPAPGRAAPASGARNRQPSQIDLATEGWEIRSLCGRLRYLAQEENR